MIYMQLHDNQSCIQLRIVRFCYVLYAYFTLAYLNAYDTLIRQDLTYSAGPMETGSAAHP